MPPPLILERLSEFRTSDKAKALVAATHMGMDNTKGRWIIPDYATDPAVRERLFEWLRETHSAGARWAILECIHALPQDALTRLRFDVDCPLPTAAADALETVVPAFMSCVARTLAEYTDAPSDTRAIVLEKGAPTPYKDGGSYKHGFKVVWPELVGTHGQMRQLDALLTACFAEWGTSEMLCGATPEAAHIVDPLVHRQNGWLMHGSQKDCQPLPYAATRVYHGARELPPGAAAAIPFPEQQRALSIFAEEGAAHVMAWTREPPPDAWEPPTRGGDDMRAELREPPEGVAELLSRVLCAATGDDASRVVSRDNRSSARHVDVRYRLDREGAGRCAHGAPHEGGAFWVGVWRARAEPYDQHAWCVCLAPECVGRAKTRLECAEEELEEWLRLEAA